MPLTFCLLFCVKQETEWKANAYASRYKLFLLMISFRQ